MGQGRERGAQGQAHRSTRPRYPQGVPDQPTTREVFALMSWRDKRLAALSQAGLVEKFVDALVWVIFPVFLVARGASLTEMGWIVGTYGFVWGGSQLFTGRLSDHVGRFWPNVLGHVDLRRWRGAWWCWERGRVVVAVGRGCGLRHGAALSEPRGRGCRHHSARLARLGHRHLPLLARPRLRHRRARPGAGGPLDRRDRGCVLVRGDLDVRLGRGALVGRRNPPAPEIRPERRKQPVPDSADRVRSTKRRRGGQRSAA